MSSSPRSTPEPLSSSRRGREYASPSAPPRSRLEPQLQMRRGAPWWVFPALLCALLAAALIPIGLGVYFGNQERADYLHQQAVEHFQRALAYESESLIEPAIAEVELALKYDPTFGPAQDKLRALQNGGAVETLVPDEISAAEQLFRGAETSVAQGQWSDAIDYLEELRRSQPDYRATELKALLIQAYVNGGKQAVANGQIDQARARFEAALALDPANTEAKSLRERAILYTSGMNAVAFDWQVAVLNFSKLYELDPNFYDVKDQLRDASASYGDFASAQGAFCIAAREYERATGLGANGAVASKLSVAASNCKQLVTAPTPTPTNELPTLGAVGGGRFTPVSRGDTGAPCEGIGGVSGTIRTVNGSALPGILVQIYNDFDYRPPPAASQPDGMYYIVLGRDPGLFHLLVLNADGTAASGVANYNYPGGDHNGCHAVIDWIRSE